MAAAASSPAKTPSKASTDEHSSVNDDDLNALMDDIEAAQANGSLQEDITASMLNERDTKVRRGSVMFFFFSL